MLLVAGNINRLSDFYGISHLTDDLIEIIMYITRISELQRMSVFISGMTNKY